MAQVIKTARIRWLSSTQPFFAGLAALPGLGGEAQNFNFHAAALEGSGEDVSTGCGNGYGTTTHGTGIIEQQGHHGIAEFGILFHFERKRMHGINDNAHEAGGIQYAFFEIEVPGTVLLGHEAALQAISETCPDALQGR